mmetsp:Transcript_12389/g.42955  ORF Transcript_12389/g.42955 Transcript_12389/m.42955 type:complete len:306 (+) Transcript_12389:528-1445(+)
MSPRRPSHAAMRTCTRSLRILCMRTWHSGSPKRTLCSRSLGTPVALSIIIPAKSTPVYGHPSETIARAVGLMSSSMIRSSIAGVTTDAGLYAPMPPVLGPVSPSPTALWSCALPTITASSPARNAKNDASSPSRNSSTTTSAPAAPNLLSTIISSTAACASSTVEATVTPLPAARPSVLTTMGAPCAVMYDLAAAGSVKRSYAAVGMSYFRSTSLRNPLLPSSLAAALDGPKVLIPAAVRSSARPSTSGCSGPTTTRPTELASQKAATAAWSETSREGTHSASAAMPALPGAQCSVPMVGDLARR